MNQYSSARIVDITDKPQYKKLLIRCIGENTGVQNRDYGKYMKNVRVVPHKKCQNDENILATSPKH